MFGEEAEIHRPERPGARTPAAGRLRLRPAREQRVRPPGGHGRRPPRGAEQRAGDRPVGVGVAAAGRLDERGSASGRQPGLAASPARFTSIRTGSVRPPARQHVSRRCRSATLSTEWTIANSSTARRALFPCRCPTRCRGAAGGERRIFSAASWTRGSRRGSPGPAPRARGWHRRRRSSTPPPAAPTPARARRRRPPGRSVPSRPGTVRRVCSCHAAPPRCHSWPRVGPRPTALRGVPDRAQRLLRWPAREGSADGCTDTGTFHHVRGRGGLRKTTQILRLADRLQRGVPVTLTREPGGTPFGQAVRRVLLDPVGPPREPAGELLLYLADRCQTWPRCIRAALAAGQVVLCSHHDATLAYQGAARASPAPSSTAWPPRWTS